MSNAVGGEEHGFGFDSGATPAPPRRRGCFFFGCLGLLVLGVVLCVALAITQYFGSRYLINNFTDTKPVPIPVVAFPEAEQKRLAERVQHFEESARRPGEGSTTLRLSASELNALLDQDPAFRGKLYLEIKDGRLVGRISVPLGDLKIDALEGRYLNGRAIFGLSARDGQLVVRAESIEVNGRPLPDLLMDPIRQTNLAEPNGKQPDEALYIEEIHIEGDEVVLTARSGVGAGAPSKD